MTVPNRLNRLQRLSRMEQPRARMESSRHSPVSWIGICVFRWFAKSARAPRCPLGDKQTRMWPTPTATPDTPDTQTTTRVIRVIRVIIVTEDNLTLIHCRIEVIEMIEMIECPSSWSGCEKVNYFTCRK